MENKVIKDRNYIFDILRIIAMMMVIIHHIVINDFGLQNALNGLDTTLSNKQVIILTVINAFVVIGVNLFFLLSGYFRTKFSIKKIVGIVVEVYLVYGIVTFIGIMTNNVTYSIDELMNLLNPFNRYWFLAAYLGICIFSPLLNIILDKIQKREAKVFIICTLIFFSIISMKYDIFNMNGGYSLIWGIILYLFAGIIRKFNIKFNKGLLLFVLCALLNALNIIYIYLNRSSFDYNPWQLYRYNNIFVILQSIGLFIWINSLKLEIKNSKMIKIITFLATSTLMTYLLHSTCWLTIFRRKPTEMMLNHGHFILGLLLVPIYAFIIYFICSIISLLYKKTVQRLINYIFNRSYYEK